MSKRYSLKDIQGGDCLILKASKQKMNVIGQNDAKVYLIVSHDIIEFPKKKLLRYFKIYKKYKDKDVNKN